MRTLLTHPTGRPALDPWALLTTVANIALLFALTLWAQIQTDDGLYRFLDNELFTVSEPGDAVFFAPEPGVHTLMVVIDFGWRNSLSIIVQQLKVLPTDSALFSANKSRTLTVQVPTYIRDDTSNYTPCRACCDTGC